MMKRRSPVRGLSALTAAVAALVILAAGASVPARAQRDAAGAPEGEQRSGAAVEQWIQLFNGRDLSGWTAKFAKHPLGVNLHDTFRVEDGLLKVRYDRWPAAFNGEFGHLFYDTPYSSYRLAAEYRFAGEQLEGGASWAIRNNGLMLHCPDPKTMLRDQDFPVSIEVQLLGGLGDGKPRPTANLCTPGTNVVMNGQLHTPHCVNSTAKTYDGDQWVRVEVEVRGDQVVRHLVDGQVVLEYSKPQIGGGQVNPVDPKVKVHAAHGRLHLHPGRNRPHRLPQDRAPQAQLRGRDELRNGPAPSYNSVGSPAAPQPRGRGRPVRGRPWTRG
jgi:hypothetical protein